MADFDVLGILSFLLAAGGVAYLVRSRFMNRGAAAAVSAPSEHGARGASASKTSAAKDLEAGSVAKEPESDGPPQASGSSGPRRAAEPAAAGEAPSGRREDEAEKKAKPEATAATAASKEDAAEETRVASSPPKEAPPAAPSASSTEAAPALAAPAGKEDGAAKRASAKDTLPSAGTPPKKEASSEAPRSEPPQVSEAVASTSRSNRPRAPTIVGGLGLSRPEPLPPKRSVPPAAKAKSEPPVESGAPPKSSEPSTKPEPETTKVPEIDDEVPRLDYEEDEELEPTRFGGKREIQPAVEKIVVDEGADTEPSDAEGAPRLALQALGTTDPGKRRKHNEDALLLVEDKGLFIVADGMGGHRGGQLASKLAVKTLADAFAANRFAAAAHTDLPAPASELARAIQMANTAILEHAAKHPELKGMGTTICAMRFSEDRRRLYIGHVGDSRCYRLRDGVMKQLTTDHTMSDYGIAGPEGAHLSRALGVWPTVPIDVILVTPQAGDLYLLCSDGLTKMLPNETIATQLLHEEDAKTAINRLVFFANAHGGKDNITIVLVRVVDAAKGSA